jgi:UDP-N-acetylglucosamine acyltransferase
MNSIHPSAIVSGDVVLGEGNTIGAFAVVTGPVVIGDGNWIGSGVVIGAPPEVRSWPHPGDALQPSSGNGIRIGNGNVIREYAQIHQGWQGRTVLGNDTFVMNQTYVAHDSAIGDGATLASSVLLAGHVTVGAGANLGLGVSVHQRCAIGAAAMVGMGAVVVADIAPYVLAHGNPARPRSVNAVGLRRAGVPDEVIAELEAVAPAQWDDDTIARFCLLDRVGPVFDAWRGRGVR